ncbi:hypothetical protein BJ742DRAFT_857619, partial [Cladochytrium replicatum]
MGIEHFHRYKGSRKLPKTVLRTVNKIPLFDQARTTGTEGFQFIVTADTSVPDPIKFNELDSTLDVAHQLETQLNLPSTKSLVRPARRKAMVRNLEKAVQHEMIREVNGLSPQQRATILQIVAENGRIRRRHKVWMDRLEAEDAAYERLLEDERRTNPLVSNPHGHDPTRRNQDLHNRSHKNADDLDGSKNKALDISAKDKERGNSNSITRNNLVLKSESFRNFFEAFDIVAPSPPSRKLSVVRSRTLSFDRNSGGKQFSMLGGDANRQISQMSMAPELKLMKRATAGLGKWANGEEVEYPIEVHEGPKELKELRDQLKATSVVRGGETKDTSSASFHNSSIEQGDGERNTRASVGTAATPSLLTRSSRNLSERYSQLLDESEDRRRCRSHSARERDAALKEETASYAVMHKVTVNLQ